MLYLVLYSPAVSTSFILRCNHECKVEDNSLFFKPNKTQPTYGHEDFHHMKSKGPTGYFHSLTSICKNEFVKHYSIFTNQFGYTYTYIHIYIYIVAAPRQPVI